MHVVDMLPDYETLVAQSAFLGKQKAYRDYTAKYPALFGFFFKYLFMAPIEALGNLVEETSFESLLELSCQNYAFGLTKLIEDTALESSQRLNFRDTFAIYMGVNLGNIGGATLVPPGGQPAIYIGIDRQISPEFIRQIVPHEVNHMVRAVATAKNMEELSGFSERTVMEGLAVYYGLVFAGQSFSWESFAWQNGLQPAHLNYLKDNASELASEVRSHFGKKMTPELHQQFFVNQSEDPSACLSGYYYGTKLVAELVNAGHPVEMLTRMPTEDILACYDAL